MPVSTSGRRGKFTFGGHGVVKPPDTSPLSLLARGALRRAKEARPFDCGECSGIPSDLDSVV